MIPWGNTTEGEEALMRREMGKAKNYLEWGMGKSTLWGVELSDRVVSVEGCKPFLEEWAEQQPELAKAIRGKRLRVAFADTGNSGPYEEPHPRWEPTGEAYSMPTMRSVPDLALIDGRFRVACAITALLMGCNRVMVHDFSFRPHYDPMLEFFEVQEAVDTLVLLRPKRKFDRRLAEERRKEFFKDPR
jgi:hypothetical protein